MSGRDWRSAVDAGSRQGRSPAQEGTTRRARLLEHFARLAVHRPPPESCRRHTGPRHIRAWYKRFVRSALSVLAAALVVAAGTGCSGNGQANGTGTTAGPTRPKPLPNQSRWAKQVDAACKPWQKRIDAVTPAPANTVALRIWLADALPLIRKQLAAIKAIKPPAKPDEARKVTRFLDTLQRTERALTRYLAASRANASAEARKALDEASASGAAARAQAASLDVTKCGGYSSG
jgi:hypothetical protein